MKQQRINYVNLSNVFVCISILLLSYANGALAQIPTAAPKTMNALNKTLGLPDAFIQNVGQYGKAMAGFENMGNIQYGYEGLGMPVLFTSKGLIHLQRQIKHISHEEEERLEKQGLAEEDIERKKSITDRTITMEWIGANPDVKIITADKNPDYHTYGQLHDKASAYRKLIYKNIYPGIDIVYTLGQQVKAGFEYSLVVNAGADLSVVRMKYDGDVKSIRTNNKGNLVVHSDINGVEESVPVSYYSDQLLNSKAGEIKTGFKIDGNEISFSFPQDYDHNKVMVIDPFVSSTANLTGANAGKAKDVDFDYAGNIYVSGGGDGINAYNLSKYNANGVLQWTFAGVLTIPAWNFGPYFGGWVVDKTTGNIYLGQGFDFTTGFIVIRLSTTGLYDNYVTAGNPNFREDWKMIWNCNNGSPQIIVAGGGTNSNINLGILAPPSVIPSAANITGIPSIAFQDMADMVIDPLTNSMYTIYASGSVPTLNNSIYKNDQPYSAGSIAWNTPSGYSVLQEAFNRPYMGSTGLNDNSANILAVNPSYLFYWDGKNLQAINKTTGAVAGTPLVTSNTALMQGGIIADACDNIFVGDINGTIKVYKFTGTVFDDVAAPDITVSGYTTRSVYDLAYDEQRKLLYTSGDGFVASFDVSAYCPNTTYTLNITPDCSAASATAVVNPAPPSGSTITYVLYNGSTQLATNTTGVFTSLNPTVTYTIVATVNQACSGSQTTASFLMPGPAVSITQTNTSCGGATGSITATGSAGTAPYTYSIDGITFQSSGTFTSLAAGVYSVTVKDANACRTIVQVVILNSDGPALTYTQTNAECGSNNGTVTANITGGTAPYEYSINAGVTYQSGNFFTGLLAGQYTLMVKDATGCTNASIITITSSASPLLTAIPSSATCGNNNGSINAFGTSGTAPLQYSINGNIFQVNNTFSNLAPGTYTVTVKDANGCSKSVTVTVANSPAPTVTATSTQAACANVNGSITATGSGGIAPLQYSLNNGPYQLNNVFTGLLGGVYSVSVQDITGCIGSTSVTVVSISGGPTVTATATASACNVNNGTITAIASSGIFPYQYSINNVNYQAGNSFTGLAPGNYVVFVKDAAGCINTFSVVVPNTGSPSLSVTATASSCNVNDGTITATSTGGTAPLQYSIDGVSFQFSNLFTGLAPNTYTVTVKDANGCGRTAIITVANASGLTLAVSTISSSCSTNSGSITATANGGAAPLQYSADGINFQLSNIFSGLAVGTYTVTVKDANGCIVTKQATVTSVSGPSLSVAVSNATCGGTNGSVVSTGVGGIPPLTYNIDGGTFQSVGTFVNLATGTHTIIVKDVNGCSAVQTITIINAGSGTPPTDVTFTIKNALGCTGATGRIKNLKGVPSGGGNNYTFSLDGGVFTTANQFTNVTPGTHTITAKNQTGCTVTKLATITNTIPATATATATGTACNTSNGTITITGVGGNTPYHASIDGSATWTTFFPPGANTATFTGLTPGPHTITMADDADFTVGPPDIPGACLTTIFVPVPSFGGPTLGITQSNGTCLLNDGSITATGNGGAAPYSFNINNGAFQLNPVFTNLGTGTYNIGVKDAAGCVSSSNVTITNPTGPAITANTVTTSCGLNNGSITATATGGVPPVQYSIDGFNFQSSNVFTSLSTGSYTLYAKDANGCYNFISVPVTATLRPQATAFTIAASCNNNDGSIIVTGSSGTIPYQYSIDGIVYQSNNTFSGVAAGFYTINIKDARGCINTTGIIVGNIGALAFTNTVSIPTCGTANGSITITATGGTAPYQYSKDGIVFQSGNILSGLLPGTYNITVNDANGCVVTKEILVGNNNGPNSIIANITNAACGFNNGSIIASAFGGSGALQYSINGTTYQAGTVFNGVAGGNYTLSVKDINGCIKSLPVTVLNLAGPSVAASSTATSCGLSDGTITVTATGGTGILGYSKDGIVYQLSNIFTGVAAGNYTITVKDEKNCTSTTTVTVDPFVVPVVTATTSDASCGNANGSITVFVTGGTVPYQYSIDGITFQSGNVLGGLAANTYTVTIKDAHNCTGTGVVVLSDSPPMAGVYTVGAGRDFNTLTAAVEAYNTKCIGGPITYLLTDANYDAAETFPITINSNIYASAIKTLTIKPAPGTAPTITANDPVAVIKFSAADYVTVDGSNSNGGTSRDLHIVNTNTGASGTVVWLNSVSAVNGATNNSVENCVLTGNSSTTTLAAIISCGSVVGSNAETANSNNSYINNSITKAQKGIVIAGAAGNDADNLISGNIIGALTVNDKLSKSGIEISRQAGCQVLNNTVFGISSSSLITASGIAVSGTISGMLISGNMISDIKNTNNSGAGANGISLSASGSGSDVNVNNNFISDVAAYGSVLGKNSGDNGYGIVITGGGGYNIYHNTVVLNTSQVVAGFPAALNITSFVSTVSAINVKDNIFGNIQTQAGSHYTIQSTASSNVFASIDYNDYYTASGSLGFIGNDRVTLSDIRTGFGSNLNSINIAPVFLSSTDLHIDPANVSNGVNLGDKGTIAGIITDIDNTTRSGITPDMGADEWIRPNYGSWVGRVSIDWLVPENWETNVVPDGNTDVTIKGGFVHMPTIVTTQAVRDLNILAPDLSNIPLLTLDNGTIQINGIINHSGGAIDGANGTVEMNGAAPQSIPENLFVNNSLNNLVIGNNTAAGVILDGVLDIYRSVEFSASGLKLTTNDFLTFKSTATETAWLGNMTGKTIIGSATVERYIPDHSKAWQFLSVPTTGQTIKQAWQEGSASPNSNPVPGYGTMISANVANATIHPDPGFDLFSPSPSIKIYNAVTGLYDGVTSTTNPIVNPKGYMLFVRGDRSVTTFSAPPTATVLRTKGLLNTPANPPPVIAVNSTTPPLSFESIGNPYASSIDLTQVTLNEFGGGVQDFFYVWDPKLTTGPNSTYGLGGFQVLSRNGATYDVTPGGGSYGATNKFIQSGQAFFVNAPFSSGTVKFTEACKASGSSMFNRNDDGVQEIKQLRTNFYVIKNGIPVLIDGNRVQYDKRYNNAIDINDAVKLDNTGENLGIKSNGKILSIERRRPIRLTDTIFYSFGHPGIQQYQFEFIANDLRDGDLAAYLIDNYLHNSSAVDLNDTTRVMFTVENIPASYASNRFMIVFRKRQHSKPVIADLDAKRNEDYSIGLSWLILHENELQSYTIERSADGKNFTEINSALSKGKHPVNSLYNDIDSKPYTFDNFYRIHMVSTDKEHCYSNTVKVLPIKRSKGITVYPNPVTDGILQVQFTRQPKGDYYIFMMNQLGQVVYNSSIKLETKDAVKKIILDSVFPAGVYEVNIVSSGGKNTSQKIIIQ